MRSVLNLLLAVPAVLALPSIERNVTSFAVPGSWLVEVEESAVLDNVLRTVQEVAGVEAKETFTVGAFKGFSFDGDDSTLEALGELDELKRIEPEYTFGTSAPVGDIERRALVTQATSTWGLSRISSRARGTRGYRYDDSAGAGTFVYVLDTGVNSGHNDFGGQHRGGGHR